MHIENTRGSLLFLIREAVSIIKANLRGCQWNLPFIFLIRWHFSCCHKNLQCLLSLLRCFWFSVLAVSKLTVSVNYSLMLSRFLDFFSWTIIRLFHVSAMKKISVLLVQWCFCLFHWATKIVWDAVVCWVAYVIGSGTWRSFMKFGLLSWLNSIGMPFLLYISYWIFRTSLATSL